MLAELANDPYVAPYMNDPGVGLLSAAAAMVVLGLYCISYPEANPALTKWSVGLTDVGLILFPASGELDRFWPAVGSQMIVVGLFFMPYLKGLLSWSPLVFMGKVSFAIYLIHGPLMRCLLAWMVFGLSEKPVPQIDPVTDELRATAWVPEYSKMVTGLAIVIFYLAVYKIAGLWVRWVDPACSRVAKRLEDWLWVEGESAEKPVHPSLPA